MYRIIIVDDEAIVRNGISQVVPWGKNGFELAGMFEHGRAALDYIEQHPVDVVISDINMPRMDGLTLSRILTERYPSILVLLLTGYDEFEYAQEAVKNQVRQFLLKPITASELGEILKKLEAELNIQRHKDLQQEQIREKLRASFPLLKERFLYRLVTGRIESQQIMSKSEYFSWRDFGQFYLVILIHIPNEWSELDRISFVEFLEGRSREADEVFHNSEEHIVLLLQDSSAEVLSLRSNEIAGRAFHHAAEYAKAQVTIGRGQVVDSSSKLHHSYSGARSAVEYSRVLGMAQILSIEDVRDKERISPEFFDHLVNALLEELKKGNQSNTGEALENIFSSLRSHYVTSTEMLQYTSQLHFMLLHFLREMWLGNSNEEILAPVPEQFESVQLVEQYYTGAITTIQERIDSRRKDLLLSRIEKARAIITERYAESNFSLKDICDELYLSSSQFSLLFKEGTGQTFVEFLTAFRVEKAKQLLKTTDLKGYEIAEKVGYPDSRYFSLIFKKLSGVTAMEYRRNLNQ